MVISVLASMAEFERELIKERTALKRATSRANGTKFGRPRKVDDTEHIATAKRMKIDGHAAKDIAKYLGVSRATLYRYFSRGRRRVNGTHPQLRGRKCWPMLAEKLRGGVSVLYVNFEGDEAYTEGEMEQAYNDDVTTLVADDVAALIPTYEEWLEEWRDLGLLVVDIDASRCQESAAHPFRERAEHIGRFVEQVGQACDEDLVTALRIGCVDGSLGRNAELRWFCSGRHRVHNQQFDLVRWDADG
jgi:hypothetical protein